LTKRAIATPNAPKPIGPYSQGIAAGGLLFVSGQIPIDPDSGSLVDGGIEAQVECVLRNLLAILKAAKMSPENVVKTTVYLTDLQDMAPINTAYARYFEVDPPARSTIQAAALPRGARVEIDLVAAF
jgi:2-iminobutanoate/2-iminopropanoate deaminase